MGKRYKSLAGKITFNLFLLSTIILFVVLSFVVILIQAKLQEDYDTKISAFLFSKSKFLAAPLYSKNYDTVTEEVNGYNYRNDLIFKEITVYDKDNNLIISSTKPNIYIEADDRIIRRDIYYHNKEDFFKVGTIEVIIDNNEIRHFILNFVYQIILVGLILLISLNYIIYRVLDYNILPVRKLSTKMLDIEQNSNVKLDNIKAETVEIKNLYEAFYQIKKHYENYQERLEGEVFDRTLELEDYKNHLEAMVQEQVEDINEAKVEAERANIAKSEFLANMSHEFRTPMHAIISYSKMGLDKGKDISLDKALKYFNNINMSGERLLDLLNDLLDLSKLESGLVIIDKKSSNLESVVNQVIAETKSLAEERHIEIIKNIQSKNLYLNFDNSKIIQVVINLFSNAIKFNKPGGKIFCNIEDYNKDGKNYLKLSVEDEGTGIPDTELRRVFDKFFQSSKTRTGAGGTGLGLAICKLIIESHKGEIWADNREDLGSIFTFILPQDN